MGDTVLDDTAVGLELRLPRATHPHTPTLALEVRPQAGQSGEHIAILSQLDLRLGVGRGSSGGEDIKDEAGAVKDLDLQSLLNVAKLLGAELVVEDHDTDLVLLDEEADFLQLTLTDEGDGVGLIKALGEATYGSHTSCGGEEVQLVEIFAGLLLVLVLSDEPDEDRFLALGFSDDKLSHNLDKNTIIYKESAQRTVAVPESSVLGALRRLALHSLSYAGDTSRSVCASLQEKDPSPAREKGRPEARRTCQIIGNSLIHVPGLIIYVRSP